MYDKLEAHFLPILGSVLFVGVLIGIALIIVYPKLKILISDILKFFGFVGKWVRKKQIETDLEGAINSFTGDFAKHSSISLFPECRVQWVTENSPESIIENGKAIVRVSFSKDNHDLNYYNAAYSYMQTGLLSKTKPFIRKSLGKAIDLFMTKNMLEKSKRSALRIFNDKFRDEEQVCKETFYKLEETEFSGLFRRIFLQEYYFFGESLGESSPKETYANEADNFLEWFYDLATREEDEKTNLSFESKHIRVGVILVARKETHEKYGINAYLKRAHLYAANDYKCIYICARGTKEGESC